MPSVNVVRTSSSSQLNSLLTQASASTTYLTQASASTTYATKASPTFTGTATMTYPSILSSSGRNTKIGTNTLSYISSGQDNVAIGYNALSSDTSGYGNVGVGQTALGGNQTGNYNVGIGYSSLGNASGSNNIGIGQYAGVSMGNGSYNVIIGSNYGSTISNLSNNIIISDGQGNIRIQADSSGRVTMPSVPAFSVYAINLQTQSGNLTYNATITNNGSYMNLGTGLFTAPVAGYYYFNYHGFVDTGLSGNTTVIFQKNGSGTPSRAYNDFNDASYGPVISISAVLYLSVNDNVRVNLSGAGMHGNENSFFKGFLIG